MAFLELIHGLNTRQDDLDRGIAEKGTGRAREVYMGNWSCVHKVPCLLQKHGEPARSRKRERYPTNVNGIRSRANFPGFRTKAENNKVYRALLFVYNHFFTDQQVAQRVRRWPSAQRIIIIWPPLKNKVKSSLVH